MPKRNKPPRVVQDSINGRGTAPENDLIPMDPKGPKCGKDSQPLSFSTESTATKRSPECLLRSHHNPSDIRRLPHFLGKWQAKNRCGQSSTALAHSGHSTGESGTMRCHKDLVINRRRNRSQAKILIVR